MLLAHGSYSFLHRVKHDHHPQLTCYQSLQGTANDNEIENNELGGLRSIASIDQHPSIPVWPTWGGGKVVPVSFGNDLQDPFLLLAHHNHWFDPRDPLRGPFKAIGKALGLPYIDVEGFKVKRFYFIFCEFGFHVITT